MNDIDYATKIHFVSNRQRKRHDRPGKAGRGSLYRVCKIRVFLFDLVDDHKSRQHEFICVLPRFFGLHLNSVNGVNDHERAIGDTQGGPGMRDKRGVTRCIDQIYLCIFVFEVGEIVVERDLSFYRIFFVIGDCRTFVDLSPAWRCSGDVEQGTDELGFTRVAVSNYSQISDVLSCKCFHGRQDLLS